MAACTSVGPYRRNDGPCRGWSTAATTRFCHRCSDAAQGRADGQGPMSTLKNLCFSSCEHVGLRAGSFCKHCLTMSWSSCSTDWQLQRRMLQGSRTAGRRQGLQGNGGLSVQASLQPVLRCSLLGTPDSSCDAERIRRGAPRSCSSNVMHDDKLGHVLCSSRAGPLNGNPGETEIGETEIIES